MSKQEERGLTMSAQIPDEMMAKLDQLADEAGLSLSELLAAARVRDFERELTDEERKNYEGYLAAIDEGHQAIVDGEVEPVDETLPERVSILNKERRKKGIPIQDVVKPPR